MPLNFTADAPVRFAPVILTLVPTGPLVGEKLLMVGAGVFLATVWFAPPGMANPLWVLAFAVLGAALMGAGAVGALAAGWFACRLDSLLAVPVAGLVMLWGFPAAVLHRVAAYLRGLVLRRQAESELIA